MRRRELVSTLVAVCSLACGSGATRQTEPEGGAGPGGASSSAGASSSGAPAGGSSYAAGAAATSSGASGDPSAGSAGSSSTAGNGGSTGGEASGGGPGGSGGAAGGGRGGSGGASGAGGGGGRPACVLMDDMAAPFVSYQYSQDAAPTATGGPITPGTYFLTNLTYYGGTPILRPCTLSQVHEVLRFSAESETTGTLHSTSMYQYEDGSGRNQYASETSYEIDGATLKEKRTCSSEAEWAQAYTATTDQFRFRRGPFDSSCDAGVVLVLTYDRQP